MAEAWIAFFTAAVGATSALAGLVIVAISINVARILSFPHLPGRAAETLIVLVGALLISSLMLFPPMAVPAWTSLAVALVAWVLPIALLVRDLSRRKESRRHWLVSRMLLAQLPTLAMLAGGWLFAAGDPGGFAVLALAVLAALVAAMLNTWVLLVEILR